LGGFTTSSGVVERPGVVPSAFTGLGGSRVGCHHFVWRVVEQAVDVDLLALIGVPEFTGGHADDWDARQAMDFPLLPVATVFVADLPFTRRSAGTQRE
jgi:hypothetical protein